MSRQPWTRDAGDQLPFPPKTPPQLRQVLLSLGSAEWTGQVWCSTRGARRYLVAQSQASKPLPQGAPPRGLSPTRPHPELPGTRTACFPSRVAWTSFSRAADLQGTEVGLPGLSGTGPGPWAQCHTHSNLLVQDCHQTGPGSRREKVRGACRSYREETARPLPGDRKSHQPPTPPKPVETPMRALYCATAQTPSGRWAPALALAQGESKQCPGLVRRPTEPAGGLEFHLHTAALGT